MHIALEVDTLPDVVAGVSEEISLAPVFAGMEQLLDVVNEVWKVMVGNPLLVVFLGGSLFSLGIWVFKKVKRAARG